jgi:hypothetical protein
MSHHYTTAPHHHPDAIYLTSPPAPKGFNPVHACHTTPPPSHKPLSLPPAPRGFNPVQDLTDNYQFLYPFGWQEVSVATADVVYKDVVEPLESVSVTITDTDKGDITEFGEINEVRGSRLQGLGEVHVVMQWVKEINGRVQGLLVDGWGDAEGEGIREMQGWCWCWVRWQLCVVL